MENNKATIKAATKAYDILHELLAIIYEQERKKQKKKILETPEIRHIWSLIDQIEKYTK